MIYVLTLVANTDKQPLTDRQINIAFMALEKQDAQIQELRWLSPNEACDIHFEYLAPTPLKLDKLQAKLDKYQLDFVVQPFAPEAQRRKKMLISDMDSTIIQQECIDELADVLGIKDQVSAITTRAMNNELDFKESLHHRVQLLKNLPESALKEVYQNRITLMPGAKQLIQTMQHHGAHCVLVSGGFTFFTSRVAQEVGFHEHHANQLEIIDGKLSGKVIEPILDKESKVQSLLSISTNHNIAITDILAIGDGANDIPMLQKAGLGVAVHAHENVRNQIPVQINYTGLESLLFFQGYHRSEIIYSSPFYP